MPAILPGQKFSSLIDFKKALHEWAVEENFTPAILDSDTHRVRAGCRSSPDCPFRIRANFHEKLGFAKVTTVDHVHNCTTAGQVASQDIKRAETCKLKFLLEVVPKLLTVDRETSTKTIMEVVERRYGQKIALRQAQKVKAHLAPPSKEPCGLCGKAYHRSGRCPQLRGSTSDSNDNNQHIDHDDGNGDGGLHYDFGEEDVQGQLEVQAEGQHVLGDNIAMPNRTGHGLPGFQQLSSHILNTTARHTQHANSLNPISENGNHNTNTNGQQASIHTQQATGVPAPNIGSTTRIGPTSQSLPTGAGQQPSRTPQETRMEAAKLMQQAARLMQEAAKLNAEAAQLTASVANS